MRRLLIAVAAAAVAALLVVLAGPPALQWWSVRRSADPEVAAVAQTCSAGRNWIVTRVEERPWGWFVRMEDWHVVYLGAEDTIGGNPNVFVTREGDRLVPWFSGSYPPSDPVTKAPLTAPGAADAWEADLALAVAQKREPYVAQRCSTRNG